MYKDDPHAEMAGFCLRWAALGGRTQHSGMPPTATIGKNIKINFGVKTAHH